MGLLLMRVFIETENKNFWVRTPNHTIARILLPLSLPRMLHSLLLPSMPPHLLLPRLWLPHLLLLSHLLLCCLAVH